MKSAEVTQFEHWASALADARNAIVHGGATPPLEYAEIDSPYSGPFVEIGDRVVREAITVLLGECGFPAAWRKGMSRASFAAYRHLADSEASQTPCNSGDSPEQS